MKPEDPQMLKALDLFKTAFGQEEAERIKTAQEIWKIVVEETGHRHGRLSPAVMGVRIVKNNLGNIPARSSTASTDGRRVQRRRDLVLQELATGAG